MSEEEEIAERLKGSCSEALAKPKSGAAMTIDTQFGTDPSKLHRRDSIDTSIAAAHAVDSRGNEKLVYDIVAKAGSRGIIQDEVLDWTPGKPYSTITARFKALLDKGLIEDTGERRPGRSGKMQRVVRVPPMQGSLL